MLIEVYRCTKTEGTGAVGETQHLAVWKQAQHIPYTQCVFGPLSKVIK